MQYSSCFLKHLRAHTASVFDYKARKSSINIESEAIIWKVLLLYSQDFYLDARITNAVESASL